MIVDTKRGSYQVFRALSELTALLFRVLRFVNVLIFSFVFSGVDNDILEKEFMVWR